MATVKLQDGKVVLKDGKVSCSCCEAAECCMYPAQALADGLHSASDLPDALTHISRNGTIRNISRSGNNYLIVGGPLGKIGAEFDPSGSSIPLWLFFDDAGSQASSRCLFQKFNGFPPGYPVEDQFADTYLVSATNLVNPDQSFSGREVARQSLCLWTGSNGTALVYQPIFSQFGQSQKDLWQIFFQGIDGTLATNFRLNTPVGSYNNRFNFSSISVS